MLFSRTAIETSKNASSDPAYNHQVGTKKKILANMSNIHFVAIFRILTDPN